MVVISFSSCGQLKAHLIAKNYAQAYSVEYFDTFSLDAKLVSVRLFVLLASIHYWPYINSILKMHFFMVFFKKRCIWTTTRENGRYVTFDPL